MVRIVVLGAAGRMGKRVVACAVGYPGVEIAGGIEQTGSRAVGKDIGEIAGIGKLGVNITDSVAGVVVKGDVCIDFTHHTATIKSLPVIVEQSRPCVICTTGFDEKELATIRKASEKIPVLLSPNMSIGVNLLFDLVGEVASKLGDDYNIEIVEAHHNQKKDSPSGTAAKIADIAAQARGLEMSKDGVYGRKGMVGARKPSEIGVHAVRAGDIVGEHGQRKRVVAREHGAIAPGKNGAHLLDAAARLLDGDDVL